MPSRIHSFEKGAGTRFLPSEMGERVGEQERRREEGGRGARRREVGVAVEDGLV